MITPNQLAELEVEFKRAESLPPAAIAALIASHKELYQRNESLWEALHTAGRVVERDRNVDEYSSGKSQEAQASTGINTTQKARRNG